jgi:TRAP-type C4-dicarboxylate transport system permease small subunit
MSESAGPPDVPPAGRPLIERVTYGIFTASAFTLLPLITVLITADAAMRYAFNAPISWAQDLAGLCLFVLFCAGLTHSMAINAHVRMDLVYDRLPRGWRRAVDALSGLFALMFSGLLAYQAVPSALTAWRNETQMPSGEVVVWPFAAVGAACLLIFGVAVIVSVLFPARAGR